MNNAFRPFETWPRIGRQWPQYNVEHWQSDRLVGWWPPIASHRGDKIQGFSGLRDLVPFGDSVNNVLWETHSDMGVMNRYDGTNYFDNIGSLNDFSFIQNTVVFTISIWVQLNSAPANTLYVFGGNTLTNGENGFFFGWENRVAAGGIREIRMNISKGASPPTIDARSNNNAITDANLHHVLIAGNGTSVNFYIDGNPFGSTSPVGVLAAGNSTRTLNIGRANFGSTAVPLIGRLGDFRIYKKILTDSEALQLFSPSTRWDLYKVPKRIFFIPTAVIPGFMHSYRTRRASNMSN